MLVGESLITADDSEAKIRSCAAFFVAPLRRNACGNCESESLRHHQCQRRALAAIGMVRDALGFIFLRRACAMLCRLSRRRHRRVAAAGHCRRRLLCQRRVGESSNHHGHLWSAMAQLHGDEHRRPLPRALARLANEALRLKVIGGSLGVGRVPGTGRRPWLRPRLYSELAHGGTGQLADWRLSAEVARNRARSVCRGGLTPRMSRKRFDRFSLTGVDAEQRVESTPGKKDTPKSAHFSTRKGCHLFVSLFILPEP